MATTAEQAPFWGQCIFAESTLGKTRRLSGSVSTVSDPPSCFLFWLVLFCRGASYVMSVMRGQDPSAWPGHCYLILVFLHGIHDDARPSTTRAFFSDLRSSPSLFHTSLKHALQGSAMHILDKPRFLWSLRTLSDAFASPLLVCSMSSTWVASLASAPLPP